MQRAKFFYFYFSKRGDRLGVEMCSSPEGLGLWAFIGNGIVVEQDVPVGLQLVWMLSLGAGSWYVLFCKFPEHLCLQGVPSNVLVLRIETRKTIRVSPASWGPGSSGKEGLKKVLLAYYFIELSCCYIQ